MEGWVGLDTTTLSKRSAQDRSVTEMTVVSYSNRHASLVKYRAQSVWALNPDLSGDKQRR